MRKRMKRSRCHSGPKKPLLAGDPDPSEMGRFAEECVNLLPPKSLGKFRCARRRLCSGGDATYREHFCSKQLVSGDGFVDCRWYFCREDAAARANAA